VRFRYSLFYLSLLIFLTLFVCFFFYGVVTPNSWVGYFQNLSLVPLTIRLGILTSIWLCVTLPFLLKFKPFKLTFSYLAFVIVFNVCLDAFFIFKIFTVSNNLGQAKQLIMARYGNVTPVKKLTQKSLRASQTKPETSPDDRFVIKFNTSRHRFDIYDKKNNFHQLSIKNFLVSPAEIFWLTNESGQVEYVLYSWAFDRDDYTKIFIKNLKTKKTALLAKGSWLYN